MRWNPKERFDPYRPHLWFAWHPVTLCTGQKVWLETVWRCLIICYESNDVVYADSMHRVMQEAKLVT